MGYIREGKFLMLCIMSLIWVTAHAYEGNDQSSTLERLARQVMLQQLFTEERIRSDGASGIKQMRHNVGGTRPYHCATHSARSVAAIHDHANYINTVGMGEVVAVLNGVEFRTRHNDYKLVRPSTTTKEYHATEPITFPDVPEEVLEKGGRNQVKEMKEWFKAFLQQDHSVRDYRKHFKPVLCYMEGAWTTNTDGLDESFDSERHHIDATSWFDLQDKIRFTSASGSKSNLENFAYLPTTIVNITDGEPVLAQWNYRILCHPLKKDLPLNRFRVVDDLAARMMYKRDLREHANTRAARFQLNPFDTDEWEEGKERGGLLDSLMAEIPGVDNYPGRLRDNAFNITAHKAKTGGNNLNETPLNAAYYHRWYKVLKKGAMGLQLRHRGFSDPNVFMAMTSNPAVPEICYKKCSGRRNICVEDCQRWTYAIPLEIIYLTPLTKWNPLNIKWKGAFNSIKGRSVRANGRNGQKTRQYAYDGANDHTFYTTPPEFYQGKNGIDKDDADTSNRFVGVLNKRGKLVTAAPTGIRILSNIEDVGIFRQRYPITPVHGEGSSVWKELEALKDIVLSPVTYSYMFHEPVEISLKEPDTGETNYEKPVLLLLNRGQSNHIHDLEISGEEMMALKKGKTIFTNCEEANGHSHNIQLVYDKNTKVFSMKKCDGDECEHPKNLSVLQSNSDFIDM